MNFTINIIKPMEKSFVSMGLCPLCEKENGTILMDRRIKDSLERFTPTLDPCEKCKVKYLENGVMLLGKETENSKEVKGVMVISDEAFKNMFDVKLPKEKIAFIDVKIMEQLANQ